jgi:hypothetical protein
MRRRNPAVVPRNDQVFQLSLTEIAFTIAFLLLLLLGYSVWQAQSARDAAQSALATALARQREAGSLDRARADLAATLRQAGASNPDAALSKLVEASALRVERDQLRQQVDDLDARLSALAPLKAPASAASAEAAASRAAASAAVAARAKAVAAAESAALAEKENTNLRGQVAYLTNRLSATTGHGGRDFPPCWADESGRVEFLFAIEVRQGEVVVAPAWPPRRQGAARALPSVDELTASPLSNTDFVRLVQPLLDWSRAQKPECRHYVELRSSISDAVQSDRARLMVERYFYKSEKPR